MTTIKINTIDDFCKCVCHIKNKICLHIIPCCNLVGKEYFNENGELDIEKLKYYINEYNRK